MSTENQLVVSERTRQIIVVSTQGKPPTIVDFKENATWGEFKSRLSSLGYKTDNMKAGESITNRTLEHASAILPDGNFNLFLMQEKSNSGGDVRTEVKNIIARDGEHAKKHFNKNENWTRTKTDALAVLLKSYKAPTTTKVTVAPAPKKVAVPVKKEAAKPTPVVKKVSPAKKEAISNVVNSVKESITKKSIPVSAGHKLILELDEIIARVQSIKVKIAEATSEAPADSVAERKTTISAEEQRKLEEQLRAFKGGLRNVI